MRNGREHRQAEGFSLFLLSVILLGLGLGLALALVLLPNRTDRGHISGTMRAMEEAQHNVLAFVVEKYRLPLPDTDIPGTAAYGFENGGAATGALPFRTMHLPVDARDETGLPLRYAPYRNSPNAADLATATSLFEPATGAAELEPTQKLPDPGDYGCSAIPASPINLLDFCVALKNAGDASASAAVVNTGPGIRNAAYVLVSGGLEDADGDGADHLLDGANDDGDLSYEDPARGREKGYDDLVRPVHVAALERELSCSALLGSLDLLLSASDDLRFQADIIEIQLVQAELTVTLNTVGTIIKFISLANAGVALTDAILEVPKACVIPPSNPAACAAAPLNVAAYTVALAVATADLIIFLDIVEDTEDARDEISDLNDAARQHVCDVIADVVAADQRGGLL